MYPAMLARTEAALPYMWASENEVLYELADASADRNQEACGIVIHRLCIISEERCVHLRA